MNERNNAEVEEVLRITLDNGEEKEFEIVHEYEDPKTHQKYVFVLPMDAEDEADEDEANVYVYRYTEQGDQLLLEEVEDEAEWDRLEAYWNQYVEDEEL